MSDRVSIEEKIRIISKIKREVDIKVNGMVIYLVISGSDLYGFPSKDSDVDYRGAYLVGTEHLLGLDRKRDVIEMKPDIVLFELKKELDLALSGNCNVLEHINAPTIYQTREFLEMKELVNDTFAKDGLYKSYRGMAMFNYKKFILKGRKTYKKYLYVLRGLMAGTYVLETCRIEPNIVTLNKYFKIPEVNVLVEAKCNGMENGEVTELVENGSIDERIVELTKRMDDAYKDCKLPKTVDPEQKKKINSWLIKLRIEKIGR